MAKKLPCEACLYFGGEPPCQLTQEQIDGISSLEAAKTILRCLTARNGRVELDALTGFESYEAMLTRLESRFSHATRKSEQIVTVAGRIVSPALALFIDGNHFKHFNDKYGHDFGDEIITTLGGMVGRAMRTDDLKARRGGDEFVAIMFGMSQAHAQAKLFGLQQSFAEGQKINAPNGDVTSVTAGVAGVYLEHAATADQVCAGLRQADLALCTWKIGSRSVLPELQVVTA